MQFDTEIHDAVRAAALEFTDDVTAATDRAICLIRQLPATTEDHANRYDEIAADLARHAVQNLVYDHRVMATRQTKRAAGVYGRPARVRVGESESVQETERAFWDGHFIGGKLLGDVTGKEIDALILEQQNQQRGARFNEEVLRYAQSQGITEDASIREFFRSRRRRDAFNETYKRLRQEVMGGPPCPDQAA